ncbi:MAG: ABC transporter substrate-binding protein [Actinomycetota bacterium]
MTNPFASPAKIHLSRLLCRLLAVTVAMALIVAACGDDDDAEANSGSATAASSSASEPAEPAAEAEPAEEAEDAEPTPTSVPDPEEPEPASTEDEQPAASATIAVDTQWGVVEVPAEAQSVVAVDEYSALSLLSVGVTPRAAVKTFQAAIPGSIIDETGIETIDGAFGEYNYEIIAGWQPDLIVMVGGPETEPVWPLMSEIAPTVVLPFPAPWEDVLELTGQLTGREGVAAALAAGITEQVTEIAAAHGDAAPTLGVLANGPAFGVLTLGQGGPISAIIQDAGFSRPAPELEPATFGQSIIISEELLPEHDADVVVVLGGNEQFFSAELLTSLPTYASLAAVQDGRATEVSGDVWTAFDAFSIYWVVQDLAAIQAGSLDEVITADDASEVWAAFLALAGG